MLAELKTFTGRTVGDSEATRRCDSRRGRTNAIPVGNYEHRYRGGKRFVNAAFSGLSLNLSGSCPYCPLFGSDESRLWAL